MVRAKQPVPHKKGTMNFVNLGEVGEQLVEGRQFPGCFESKCCVIVLGLWKISSVEIM